MDLSDAFPPDPTASGYQPRVGERVEVTSGVTGRQVSGYVVDNRAGLFVRTDDGEPVVFISASTWVRPLPAVHPIE